MPSERDLDLAFTELLRERAPPGIEVVRQPAPSRDSASLELLLIRRSPSPRRDEQARVLRGLWPHLSGDALVGLHGPALQARRGDLLRLVGFACEYYAREIDRLERPEDLTIVLVVATVNPALHADVNRMDWRIASEGAGYARIEDPPFPMLVVEIERLSQPERDELLELFGRPPATVLG